MIRVQSSNLHSHAYDPVAQVYSVKFNCSSCAGGKSGACAKCGSSGHTGQIYDYEGVDADRWGRVRDAESVGSAFHREIKTYKHPAGHPEEGQGFKFSKRPA